MAKRGRKPDPPQLRVLKANAAKAGGAGPFAGIRTAGEPEKPDFVAGNPEASALWDRLVSLLSDKKILSQADEGILACYCLAWAEVAHCTRVLASEGYMVSNDATGAVKAHPLLGVRSGAQTRLSKFASMLGLSPVDRGRITTLEDVTARDDAAERFFS